MFNQTPCPRSGSVAGRSYPTSKAREVAGRRYPMPEARGSGWEELPDVQSQGQRPRVPGRDGAETAERSYPVSEVKGGGWEEPPHVRGQGRLGGTTPRPRKGGSEEIPFVQGKLQRLHFAGAAVKRYPTSKVRETQVRW